MIYEVLKELEGKTVHISTKSGKKFKGILITVWETHVKLISRKYGASFIQNASIDSINEAQEEEY